MEPKRDLTAIKTLIATSDYLSEFAQFYFDTHNNTDHLKFLHTCECIELEIGKEYCRITSDRNSMDVAKLIKIDYAKKLVKDIEEGKYK